uniref:Uncharacterized protein n=1 Tax=Meloidogyne floridensis TaxID=298350 RepID=A0A915P3Q5_9BILA
ACIQEESIRPNMQEIVDFLNDEIVEFEYERNIQHNVHRDDSPLLVAPNVLVLAVEFDGIFQKILQNIYSNQVPGV